MLLFFGISMKSFKKTNKTKLMFCKPLLLMAELKAFKDYTNIQNEAPQ